MNTVLKSVRINRGLTQVEVADKINITERAYQRYEAAERVPNVKTALKLSKILNTTVEKLFPE